jgi:hypothetical protein
MCTRCPSVPEGHAIYQRKRVKVRHLCPTSAPPPMSHSPARLRLLGDTVSWLQHAAKWEEPPGEEGPAPGVPVPVLSRVRRRRTGTPRPANRFRQSDSIAPWPSRAIWASPMPPTPIRESGPERDPSTRAIHIRLAQVEWAPALSLVRSSIGAWSRHSIDPSQDRTALRIVPVRQACWHWCGLGSGSLGGQPVGCDGWRDQGGRPGLVSSTRLSLWIDGPKRVPERITGTS